MRFPASFLDELQSRLSLVDVVGAKVSFDARRSNPQRDDYWACCPFHEEKTPSFHVEGRRGFYKCFGCGAHGNLFKFVQETENLSFAEAVRALAERANLPVPAPSPAARREYERSERHIGLHDLATRFFADCLGGREGREASHYLQGRGFGLAAIEAFKLGYAPANQDALLKAAQAHGFGPEDLVEAGLWKRDGASGRLYPGFRDRIMFPIADRTGRVIAFGGRAMDPDHPAKYLNSPETTSFKKGQVLFNYANVRASLSAARGRDQTLVIVEGYTDVIALWAAGYKAAVGVLGTAVTSDHLAQLWRLNRTPVLCLDGDEAGRRAAWSAAQNALPVLRPGHSLRIATLPDGFDPDDLVRRKGLPAVQELVTKAEPLDQLLYRLERARNPVDTPEAEADLETRLLALAEQIGDPHVKWRYRDAFLARFRSEFNRFAKRAGGRSRLGAGDGGQPYSQPTVTREKQILAALLFAPWLIDRYAEALSELTFSDKDLDQCRMTIIDAAASVVPLDRQMLERHLKSDGFEPVGRDLSQIIASGQIAAFAPSKTAEQLEAWFVELVCRQGSVPNLQKELSELAERLAREETPEALKQFLRVRDLSEQAKRTGMAPDAADGEAAATAGRPRKGAAKAPFHN